MDDVQHATAAPPPGQPVPPAGQPPGSPPAAGWWPGPHDPAGTAVLASAAVTAAVSAALVPLDRPGLGWLLAAAVAAVAVAVRARAAPRRSAGRARRARAAWAAAALALTAVGTLRAAGWLFALCLLAAGAAGSLAVVGGRPVRAHLFGLVGVPAAALRCLPWLAAGLAAARRGTGRDVQRLAASAAVAAVLLAVFGSLLAGADAVFATLLSHLLPTVDTTSAVPRVFVFALAGVGVGGACFVLEAPPALLEAAPAGRRPVLRRVEWVLPVGVLVVLFCGFVAVQAAAMFGGADYVRATAGLTYAQYARGGFWQLLAVTVLTLGVIAAAVRWAPAVTRVDRVWLRCLLGALACLTLVVVASALTRMWAYQQAYGFTVLRLLVGTCELWLGMVYLLVVVAGAVGRAGWFPAAVTATALAALLGLALLDPERFVADRDVDRWERTGRIDVAYLSGLSADAVAPLRRLPEPLRTCVLSPIAARTAGDGWWQWNVGRAAARPVLAAVHPTAPCGTPVGSR